MNKIFNLNNIEFSLSCGENTSAEISLIEEKDGVSCYKVAFGWEKLSSPEKITLSFAFPCVDTYSMWDPINKLRFLPFGNSQDTDSQLGNGMPLKGVLSRSGDNSLLMAISDVKSPINQRIKASPFKGTLNISVEFFTMLTGPFKSYEAILRIDRRHIPFCDALYGVREWFESLGYKNPHIPEDAKYPMYSTWYSYGQDITDKDVIKECEEAVKVGMKAVIIDDGWQTDDTSTIYGYCGDWKPILHKFGDMKGLVDKIHALGMKVMLWYSVPFMGKYAENCKEFEGMYLRYFENTECYAFDPRYKKVREFLTDIYATAVKEWGLDGLKLDFIDRFKTNGELSEDMDFVSVEDAVQQLLEDISTALKAINPDILIEFRQPYFGPVVSTYGNMMRVWDCPLDGVMNKNQTINLRLVSGDCAVHSDMIYWHREDTPESAALQLWGTVFSVPQISTRMEEITAEQSEVLKNYLSFWNTHREALTKGRLKVKFAENGYGYAETTHKNETIAIMSASPIFEINAETCYAVNLTDSNKVIIKNPHGKAVYCAVRNCRGAAVGALKITERITEIEIPTGGMAEITV